MTTLALLAAGVLLIAAGIVAFRKFPGIRIKYIWIVILAGVLLFITGVLLSFFVPSKGLLSEGKENSTANDDVSGRQENGEEAPSSPGSVVIEGNTVIINGEVMQDMASFDNYIATSGWQGGYELTDRYASFEAYEKVLKILEDRGKTVLSERSVE